MSFMSMLQMAKGKEPSPGAEVRAPAAARASKQGNRNSNKASSASIPSASAPSKVSASIPSAPSKVNAIAPSKVSSKPSLRVVKSKPRTARTQRTAPSTTPIPKEPVKRISFKDAMKQAKSIDKSKLEISLKTTNSRQPYISKGGRERAKQKQPTPNLPQNSTPNLPQNKPSPAKAPFAQPNAAIQARLKSQQPEEIDSDSEELSDFVVSEEGEDVSEEIWSLYNRKPRQQYEEFSDDDMEATGADILNEERRSASQARKEDLEEERKLEELQRKKARRRH